MTELIAISMVAGAVSSYPLLKWGLKEKEALEKIESFANRYLLLPSVVLTGLLLLLLYAPEYMGIVVMMATLANFAAGQILENIKRSARTHLLLDTAPSNDVEKASQSAWVSSLSRFLLILVILVLLTEGLLSSKIAFVFRYPQAAVFVAEDRILPGLLDAVKSSDRELGSKAVTALIELRAQTQLIEMGESAAPALIAALEVKDINVRSKIREILEGIGPAVVPSLIKALGGRKNPSRSDIAMVMGKIGDRLAVQALILALSDSDSEVRGSAATALGQIKDPAAVAPLVDSMKVLHTSIVIGEMEKNIGWRSLVALGEIGHPSALPAIIPLLGAPQFEIRKQAAKSLGQIGDPAAIPALIKALKIEDEVPTPAAAEALGMIGGDEVVIALTEALDTKNVNVRMRVISALGESKTESAAPVLLELANDPGVEMRWIAVLALGRMGDKSQLPHLIDFLQDRNDVVRRAAAIALGELEDERCVILLISALRTSSDSVKIEAAKALGRIGDPVATLALRETLDDDDDLLRKEAVAALGAIKGDDAIEALIIALKDSSINIAASAAVHLALMDAKSAIPHIEAVHTSHSQESGCGFCFALTRLK